MKQETFLVGETPAVLLGESSEKVYIFVHGLSGSKAEAELFAQVACEKGYQVLGIDLPEHGGRTDGKKLVPWDVIPELKAVIDYAKQRWASISLRANSIGALFSMLAFGDEKIRRYLLVSPLVDMKKIIANMMQWAGVTESDLEREGEIETSFGQTLSYKYLCYVRENPIRLQNADVEILYAGNDNMTDAETMDSFAQKFGGGITVMPNGEHWFHTAEQLEFLKKWETEHV